MITVVKIFFLILDVWVLNLCLTFIFIYEFLCYVHKTYFYSNFALKAPFSVNFDSRCEFRRSEIKKEKRKNIDEYKNKVGK